MTFVYVFVAVLAFLAVFVAGAKYGVKLESDAFAELVKIRAAIRKTGLQVETILTGDLHAIRAEASKILHL
jgi:hypothetical protein